MQNVGSRGNGIASEKKRTSRLLRGKNKSPSGSGVTVYVSIITRTYILGLYTIGRYGSMYVSSVVITGLKYFGIGFVNSRFTGKLVFQMMQRGFKRTVKEPAYEAKSKYVAALHNRLIVKARISKRGLCHRSDRHFKYLSVKPKFFERVIGREQRLLQISRLE